MQYVKKITTASTGLEPAQLQKIAQESGKGSSVAVLRVYGKILSKKDGSTTVGPFTAFIGEMEAVNLITGEKYRSKRLILPDIAAVAMNELFDKAKAADPEGAIVFGVDITTNYHESQLGGYKFKYGVKPLIEPKGDDALSLLGKEFGPLPLLAGPTEQKSSSESAPEPETKKSGKKQ